jgi:hypothetical protein
MLQLQYVFQKEERNISNSYKGLSLYMEHMLKYWQGEFKSLQKLFSEEQNDFGKGHVVFYFEQ